MPPAIEMNRLIRHPPKDTKKDLEADASQVLYTLRVTIHASHFMCYLERAMGFEPTTTCLGSKDSTTELRPLTEPNPTLGPIASQESSP